MENASNYGIYFTMRNSDSMLSANFREWEMLHSQTAINNRIDNNWAMDIHRVNAVHLCNQYLEPLRAALATPLIITSGYRSPRLNRMIGGKARSAHQTGEAADIVPLGVSIESAYITAKDLARAGEIPLFDQLILYRNKGFIHFGISDNPRGECYIVNKGNEYTLTEIIHTGDHNGQSHTK